jgi:hypothetical protein
MLLHLYGLLWLHLAKRGGMVGDDRNRVSISRDLQNKDFFIGTLKLKAPIDIHILMN